ncbi:SymE family type I addiction module toxin [Erwinia psidii]|uniref:Uncharacterized protein n=1 Tax=Erwinia psidii TaxID=69224 RepID=A0A3N6RVC5_9GAMM|nr:hypothetical protein [Erwinia psidii]RQM36317.1 hypothetical protein EB241_21205 [Erwinia psidii]
MKDDWLPEAGYDAGYPVNVRLNEGRRILAVWQRADG